MTGLFVNDRLYRILVFSLLVASENVAKLSNRRCIAFSQNLTRSFAIAMSHVNERLIDMQKLSIDFVVALPRSQDSGRWPYIIIPIMLTFRDIRGSKSG